VETLEEAWALRLELRAHESAVTRDGIWVGAHWLRVSREFDPEAGILHRAQEIKGLKQQTQALQVSLTESMDRLEQARQTLGRWEQEEAQLQTHLAEAQEAISALRSELVAQQVQWEQTCLRKQRIETESQALQAQQATIQGELASVRLGLESIRCDLGSLDEQRSALTLQRDRLRQTLTAAREHWRGLQDKSHAAALRLESLRSQQTSALQALKRHEDLAEQTTIRCSELSAALIEGEAPLERMRQQLEAMLTQRLEAETALGLVRAQSQALETALRQREGQRAEGERRLEGLRKALEQARLEAQAIRVRLQGQEEQLASFGVDVDRLLAELPVEAEKEGWEQRLQEVEQKIARLGAINLAAIDEYAGRLERKTYLDSQHADLSEALATLEKAIRKIDKETEIRFKETFEQVNAGLQTMFRTLFEGGHAYLELTGEDLLEAGVNLMARPPGKRNSTIHLLSGGEKALTALALIFAIFELNPSPFCLLDEVDAPLDDTNVDRLCRMLKAMANRVQFLFVTHNKITMEIAERLIGVTMQEPGVSRLVAVDIDEAARIAAMG
jgi:chromosome segregation protein